MFQKNRLCLVVTKQEWGKGDKKRIIHSSVTEGHSVWDKTGAVTLGRRPSPFGLTYTRRAGPSRKTEINFHVCVCVHTVCNDFSVS